MKAVTSATGGAVTGDGDMTSPTRTPRSFSPTVTACSSAIAALTRKNPMSASHSPPNQRHSSAPPIPRTISANPKKRPARAATTAARARSPVAFHTAARSTRPPSSGAAGTRLNSASSTLMNARYNSVAVTRPSPTTTSEITEVTPNSPPSTRLVAGPTAATARSAPGERGSPRSSATPPSSHNTIRSTLMPLAWATTAWDSSWTRTDATSSTAAVAPARTYRQAGWPGYRAGKCHTPNAKPTSTRMTSTPALAPTGTSNHRPNDTVARIPCLLRPPRSTVADRRGIVKGAASPVPAGAGWLHQAAGLGVVAGGRVPLAAVGEGGDLLDAPLPFGLRQLVGELRAPGPEPASRRRVDRRGDVPGEQDPLPGALLARVRNRDRGDERLGVRVRGLREQLLGRRELDNPSQVHDRHPAGDVPHHGQVVGHEQVRQVELPLEVLQQVDDAG